MAKKQPARPAKKAAKTTSRKPERSKGELSSEDLDSVAGGITLQDAGSPIETIKFQKIVPVVGASTPPGDEAVLRRTRPGGRGLPDF